MTVVSIVGARPQFIKAATISRALKKAGIRELLVHTGQHYDDDMAQVFFNELDLPVPGVNLGVGSGSHAQQTGRMMMALEPILCKSDPDWVIIYGDTNSTLAGSLTAAKLHLRIAHVEAGLRSFNRRMPEEINRVVTDSVSDLLFAPTDSAVHNLKNEGVPQGRIALVGDVMFDAAKLFAETAAKRSKAPGVFGVEAGRYVLATIHRAENTDDPETLRTIYRALKFTAATHQVVWPLHPRTRNALQQLGLNVESDGKLVIVPPVGYFDMVQLERNASVIVTDSGGVQKEAFFYRTPCVTVRTETEWMELVDAGWNRLSPPLSASSIAASIAAAIGSEGWGTCSYGNGNSASLIAEALQSAKAAELAASSVHPRSEFEPMDYRASLQRPPGE